MQEKKRYESPEIEILTVYDDENEDIMLVSNDFNGGDYDLRGTWW